MKTSVITINAGSPEKEKLSLASSAIRGGRIVAFPTDTVYGLGVDIFNEETIKRLYRVKRRPLDKPTAILIARESQLCELVHEVPETARVLMKTFWPGALTIALPAAAKVSHTLMANSQTIGIRIPGNRIAISLVQECGIPITSSSANISGHLAACSKDEVLKELGGEIDMVIDGGPSNSRVPSTVVDMTGGDLDILREGKIPRAALQRALEMAGFVVIHKRGEKRA